MNVDEFGTKDLEKLCQKRNSWWLKYISYFERKFRFWGRKWWFWIWIIEITWFLNFGMFSNDFIWVSKTRIMKNDEDLSWVWIKLEGVVFFAVAGDCILSTTATATKYSIYRG